MTNKELKEFRVKHNLSQSQLADIVGVKANTVSKWESGIRNIGQSAIKILESYTGENEKNSEFVKKETSIEELISQRVSETIRKELKEKDAYVTKVLEELMDSVIHLIPVIDRMSDKIDKIERDIKEGNELIKNNKM